jgi:benzoyl-CoA 2,3-dioxygenase component B
VRVHADRGGPPHVRRRDRHPAGGLGGEISSNAADAFACGIKGRHKEDRYTDHRLLEGSYAIDVFEGGRLVSKEVPMRTALNEVLRAEYIKDCQRGVDRWNKTIAEEGGDFVLRLPSNRFHRQIGIYAGHGFDPAGTPMSLDEWQARRSEWLPDAADETYVKSLMQPVTEPGKIAGWLAPPAKGINGLPEAFEYVRLA